MLCHAVLCCQVPAINSSWMGDFVRQYHNVDVNVAVASPGGLMVPFVRDADKKGLLAISEEVKGLAAKVGDDVVCSVHVAFTMHQ